MDPEDAENEEIAVLDRGLLALSDPWMTTEPQLYGPDAPENTFRV